MSAAVAFTYLSKRYEADYGVFFGAPAATAPFRRRQLFTCERKRMSGIMFIRFAADFNASYGDCSCLAEDHCESTAR